ncbi:hypothetical protein [Streptomyces sp. NPDC096012]
MQGVRPGRARLRGVLLSGARLREVRLREVGGPHGVCLSSAGFPGVR